MCLWATRYCTCNRAHALCCWRYVSPVGRNFPHSYNGGANKSLRGSAARNRAKERRTLNMAKVKPWNEENTKEALRLYKQGTSVAELKKRFQSYGNPIVTRLKAAGVYKAGRAVAATKPVKVKAGKKAAAPQATLRTNGMTTKE